MQHLPLVSAVLLCGALGSDASMPRVQSAPAAISRPARQPAHTEHEDRACTPGYDPCIPPGPDVDCAGGSGDGPRYVEGPIRVTGADPYRLDGNHDGIGCE